MWVIKNVTYLCKCNNYINELTKVAFNVSGSSNPALDLAGYYLSSILAFEERYKFVKEPNYLKYKEAIDNLIEVIDNKQKYDDVKEFSRTINRVCSVACQISIQSNSNNTKSLTIYLGIRSDIFQLKTTYVLAYY